jgi:hypothetical protein
VPPKVLESARNIAPIGERASIGRIGRFAPQKPGVCADSPQKRGVRGLRSRCGAKGGDSLSEPAGPRPKAVPTAWWPEELRCSTRLSERQLQARRLDYRGDRGASMAAVGAPRRNDEFLQCPNESCGLFRVVEARSTWARSMTRSECLERAAECGRLASRKRSGDEGLLDEAFPLLDAGRYIGGRAPARRGLAPCGHAGAMAPLSEANYSVSVPTSRKRLHGGLDRSLAAARWSAAFVEAIR